MTDSTRLCMYVLVFGVICCRINGCVCCICKHRLPMQEFKFGSIMTFPHVSHSHKRDERSYQNADKITDDFNSSSNSFHATFSELGTLKICHTIKILSLSTKREIASIFYSHAVYRSFFDRQRNSHSTEKTPSLHSGQSIPAKSMASVRLLELIATVLHQTCNFTSVPDVVLLLGCLMCHLHRADRARQEVRDSNWQRECGHFSK